MKEIKSLIDRFSATERQRFLRFLGLECPDSIYHSLFISLLSKDTKTKQELFEILYPNETYKDSRMRLVFHRSKNLLLDFIASTKKTELEKFKQVDSFYKQKKIDGLRETFIAKNAVKVKLENDSYHYLIHFDSSIKDSDTIISLGNRSVEPKLQEAHNALDYFYFIEKLKLACNTSNYTRLTNHTYSLRFLIPIVDYLQNENLVIQPLLYLYFHTYLFIAHQDEAEFNLVLEYLKNNPIPENDDYREILISCLNFCIQKINKGQHEYAAKTLEVYQLQLSSKNIYVNGKLPSNTFKNVATLGLRLKEYDWTLNFIETEKTKLASKFPEEDYQLVKARYHFEISEYDRSIQLIQLSRPTDVLDSLQFRVLLCKAHFENDEWELVDSTIQNAKIFLLRHKSKAYQLQIYKNFFKLLHSIIHSKQSKTDIAKLITLIAETNPAAEKAWLIEKVREIEN